MAGDFRKIEPTPVPISASKDLAAEARISTDDFSCTVNKIGYTGINMGRDLVVVSTVPAGIVDPIFPLADFTDDDRGTLNAFIDMMLGKVEERLAQ